MCRSMARTSSLPLHSSTHATEIYNFAQSRISLRSEAFWPNVGIEFLIDRNRRAVQMASICNLYEFPKNLSWR